MWKDSRTRHIFIYSSLALLFSAPFAGSQCQAEAPSMTYSRRLEQLQNNLTLLEKHSEQKQELLKKQDEQLKQSKAKLDKAENQLDRAEEQLKIVNEQIKKSQELNEVTKNSLEKANQSFKIYEKDVEHKMKVKTRQRNLWISISGVLLGYIVTK